MFTLFRVVCAVACLNLAVGAAPVVAFALSCTAVAVALTVVADLTDTATDN